MHRFFIDPADISGTHVVLSGAEAHHLRSVLRLEPGERIELLDGAGTVYLAQLTALENKTVTAVILEQHRAVDDDPFPLTLGMGLLKGKKMDLVIQKATELGVSCLLPLETRRSMREKRDDRRQARRERIMREACKQCGRAHPMTVSPVLPLESLDMTAYAHAVLCWEQEEHTLLAPSFFQAPGPVLLLIGPEGGFHEEEIHWARQQDVQLTTLGNLTLRAETAAITGIGIIRHLCALRSLGLH